MAYQYRLPHHSSQSYGPFGLVNPATSSTETSSNTNIENDTRNFAQNLGHGGSHAGLIGQPIPFVTGQFAGNTIRAELVEIQKANLGRKYARVDRRPLDPPPVVSLKLFHVTDEAEERELSNEGVQALGLNHSRIGPIVRPRNTSPYHRRTGSGSISSSPPSPTPSRNPSQHSSTFVYQNVGQDGYHQQITSSESRGVEYQQPRIIPGMGIGLGNDYAELSVATTTDRHDANQGFSYPEQHPTTSHYYTQSPTEFRSPYYTASSTADVYSPQQSLRSTQQSPQTTSATISPTRSTHSREPSFEKPASPTAKVVHHVEGQCIIEGTQLTNALVGATFVQPTVVDWHGKKTLMFVFADLAVKTEGSFILRYRVFDIFSRAEGTDDLVIQAECYGGPFRVYSTKEFPGLQASTELTKLISRYGVRINIRETERKRRKKGELELESGLTARGKRKHHSDDEEDQEED
ncbi:hypothetical protein VNI00_000318 [Paramarasmius palmivorus]|uniref:Velvet domain-containing protein n=1 Tax=Paramarasmius palmivorus TaxID=297713 RepID=A0AAW0EDX0_9AGAR